MNRTKNTARRRQPSSGVVQDLRPGTKDKMIISNSRQNASPNLDREGGISSMDLGFILACIGAACLTAGLMRAIDQIER